MIVSSRFLVRSCNHTRNSSLCRLIRMWHKDFRGLTTVTSRRVFSGIQPTGSLHLGNYFGAVQKWVELQNLGGDTIFSIVDMHSITLPQDPNVLQNNVLKVTASLIACGIDPEKSVIFQQSKVSQHAELCWVLGCLTTMARLAHLPQFKEKSATLKEVPLGLYLYPVLQCADILLYRATEVPVGEDQVQHLQLAQHLAKAFNNRFGYTFPIPRAVVGDTNVCRVKSLRDPSKKMSKSDVDSKSRIDLCDSPEIILDKCQKALTDFQSAITFEPEHRAGVSNLISIHSLFTGQEPCNICKEYSDIDTGKYKLVVANVIQDYLKPIRERTEKLMADPLYLQEILEQGSRKARSMAEETWQDVRKRIGFSSQ
ncbi:hypothetical protein R5R35_004747 [Gryllus longicercus]|uniref:Tryptophan--tRNA ligase, mitochondrial n=1 Tax=Gryllus longicercus TaxID=2509291 RepID=A0AAN9VV22_9ORTH